MCGTKACLIKESSVPSAETRENGTLINSDAVINLDQGDPVMYESYWRKMGNKCDITFSGYESLSYFSNAKNLCWFLEPKLEDEIKKLHNVVGNAVVDDHYIVVGTGSSQLIQAALYALSHPDEPEPISVVSAAPFYSAYAESTDIVRSGLFKWAGDARKFNEDGPYIELITSPNNPDGVNREPVVNRDRGTLIHDLAYYWPQYTPISSPANYDVMLFTISKCTGHAGSRIGWAIIKNKEVAKKMVKFMEVSSIGVSKEAQLRAAKILGVISKSCLDSSMENFFEYSQSFMTKRWERLRQVVKAGNLFILQKYPLHYCQFTRDFYESHPAFAWLKCKGGEEDFEKLLKVHKILTRSGRKFGSDPRYVRISMLSNDEDFNIFLQRLMVIQGVTNGN